MLLEDFERSVILWALASSGGQQNRAAALLGTVPSTLSEKLKRLGIFPFERQKDLETLASPRPSEAPTDPDRAAG